MRVFRELGAVVESRWRKQNYNEDLFPEIAARALHESDLIAKVDPWEIISLGSYHNRSSATTRPQRKIWESTNYPLRGLEVLYRRLLLAGWHYRHTSTLIFRRVPGSAGWQCS